MSKDIYLDFNATTPVDPSVLQSMLPYFTEKFGNAASKTHSYGWLAEEAVEIAREQVALLIGSEKNEITFTSGATESINLGLKGIFEAYSSKGKHIVTIATEHKAVLDCCKHLEKYGAEITYLPVDSEGQIDLNILISSITDKTILCCLMLANNETGVVLPMKEISAIVHEKNCLLMSDATQACGKIEVDVNDLGIDVLTLSAHKMYGPKGAGALYLRRRGPRVHIIAQQDGGGHENNRRSGTLNVPGIVGLGKACELSKKLMPTEYLRIKALRDKLESSLQHNHKVSVRAQNSLRLPNTSNISFPGFKADRIIKKLNNLAVATGSACSSALPEASHVLKAMGMSEQEALSSIRFSLGRNTSTEDIESALKMIENILAGKPV
ncbi:MAG: cysteine desulfurase [Bacteroidetes bacterium]|nr:MAG: cysteine desulfurase [Bacteroidota bacterium]